MKINNYHAHLRLPRALYFQGREIAHERGETLSMAIRRAIEAYVASAPKKSGKNTDNN